MGGPLAGASVDVGARALPPPHNLPAPVTRFVGRYRDLAATATLLAEERLVTLTGAGGCGKTRLAVELGGSVPGRFPDGVWLVDLAPLADGALLPSAVAGALDLAEIPGRPLEQTVADHLVRRTALILLDNCEHLVQPCAEFVERLLRSCPGVRVLATSREPLGVDGESNYRVPSLELPADDGDTACASVRLFLDRARLAHPAIPVAGEDLAAVVKICRRLDGLPLPIELAAARCRVLAPRQIADQLDVSFALMGARRTGLPRHRTIDASIDWSWNVLSADERLVFRRLSVFAGGFTLEAAAAVCGYGPVDAEQVSRLVVDLCDKSLVVFNHTAPRYRLLETIRQYARAKSLTAGDDDELRRRHARYFAGLAERAGEGLFGADLLASQRVLDAEIDNLRAADDWAATSGETELALRLHSRLRLFWPQRVEEGARRLDRVLALPGGDPATRGRVLLAGSEVACHLGDVEGLARLANQCLGLVAGRDQAAIEGEAHGLLAWSQLFAGDESAGASFEKSIPLLRKSNAEYVLIDALWGHGTAALYSGASREARQRLDEALSLAERIGNPLGIGRSLLFAGMGRMLDGELDNAEAMLESAVSLLGAIGDDFGALFAASVLPFVGSARGNHDDALAASARTLAEAQRLNNYYALAFGSWSRLVVEHRLGTGRNLLPELDDAEQLSTDTGLPWVAAWCRAMRAEHLVARGDVAGARHAGETAVELAGASLYAARARGRTGLALARVHRAEGDREAARDVVHQVLSIPSMSYLSLETIDALELLGGLLAEGNGSEALRLLASAAAARAATGYARPPADAATVERDAGTARRGVDPATAADAWRAGSELSLEDAVAHARRGRGPRRRPTSGWGSLTPVELEVVSLVARGLRNADVAARLFVSPATVKSHLGHIFKKLGVASRAELANLAARKL